MSLVRLGKHFSPKTQFKKGIIPWNKTNTIVECAFCKKEFVISPSRKQERNFCSRNCYCQYSVGKPRLNSRGTNLRRAGILHPMWRGGKPKCLDCKIEINYRRKYCIGCNIKYKIPRIPWNKNTQIIECQKCSKKFEVSLSSVGKRKFCSTYCSRLGQLKGKATGKRSEQAKKNIIAGGTTFKKGSSVWNKGRHYSEEQRTKMRMAQQKRVSQPGYIPWNKGIRSLEACSRKILRDAIESLWEYKDWRKDVLKRDDYTCAVPGCGEKKNIHVHHMTTVKTIIKLYDLKTMQDALNCPLLWKVSNGVVLCKEHHNNAHKPNFNRLKKREWGDLEEFVNFHKENNALHLIQ